MKLLLEGIFKVAQFGHGANIDISFCGKYLTVKNTVNEIEFVIFSKCKWFEYYPQGFEEGAVLPSIFQITPVIRELHNVKALIEVDFAVKRAKNITIIRRDYTVEQLQKKAKMARENLYNIIQTEEINK